MQAIEYDLECFINFFNSGLKDFTTKEVTSYEVSEERDERLQIYNFFSSFKGYLIHFNGIHYDNVVISYFLKHFGRLKRLPKEDFLLEMYQFSCKVINDDHENVKEYKWMKHDWIDIDLYMYWAKMLRISKKISLKSLGIQLDYPVVQQLPLPPHERVKKEDLPAIRHYNNEHDLGVLDLLTIRQSDEIALRASIKKEFGLDCMSWDAIKIASEALLKDYCQTKKIRNPKDIRSQKFNRPILFIREVLKDFNPDFKLPIFQNLYERILNGIDEFSEELLVIQSNTAIRLTYGVGGLHSVNKDESYYTSDDIQIVTSDAASLYPNLIINYKTIRYPEVLARYTEIKAERLIAKKEKNKKKDIFYKLILNGVSGLLDQAHSWLYFPEGALKLRLIGQLILTKVVELCILNNWQVISANTDGVEVLVPKNELEKYTNAFKEIEKMFNLDFEHQNYNKIIYSNVNSYIAQTDKGEIKKKGFYKTKDIIPLGDSVNELIIAKALENYFINNIPVEDTVKNPENDIYLYCCSKKVNKDYTVWYNGQKQQNLNRYYFSTPAPNLFKKKVSKETMENMHVGNSVQLFNTFEKKKFEDYKIDYSYYLIKLREIIYAIEKKKIQGSLF